jgi:presenilin-like A22 family membrane protease
MTAVFLGTATLGWALFGEVGGVIFFSAAVIIHYGFLRVWSFDLALIIGLAGVALNLGRSISAVGAAVILSILSIYDLIAVYGTKHMVKMAKGLLESGASFALIVPLAPVHLRERLTTATHQQNPAVESGLLRLGAGDIVLPSILAVATSRAGLFPGLAVLLGATIGLTVNLVIFFNQARPRPMPALPAPAAGAILAFLAVYLLV